MSESCKTCDHASKRHIKALQEGFECKECETCEFWDKTHHCCDFDGICEYPVDPKFIQRENEYIYGE